MDCNFGIFQHGEWKLVLDDVHRAFSELQYDPHAIEPPFVNKDGLYFKIYREGFFSSVGKFFGMEDLEIGDPFFDESFVIKGNNHQKLISLLSDEQLKNLIHEQPRILFEIRDDEGWFGPDFLRRRRRTLLQPSRRHARHQRTQIPLRTLHPHPLKTRPHRLRLRRRPKRRVEGLTLNSAMPTVVAGPGMIAARIGTFVCEKG